ncbi:MAG: futalosine hydrolase [Draconibacterium sp.]
MKILIVAATWLEVKMLTDEFELVHETTHLLRKYSFDDIEIDVLITGIGVTFTTFHLTNALAINNYNLVINIGIAGSLTKELEIGEVVNVVTEEFGDLGIEKENEFLTLFDAGYMDTGEFPFETGILKPVGINGFLNLKKVRGLTASKSHGRNTSINEIKTKFSAQVESMEGAAVFFVCNWLGVDCCQIRAISNYVEPRDTASWNIPLALQKLSDTVIHTIRKMAVGVN